LIADFRRDFKSRNTYLKGIEEKIDADGRCRSTYNVDEAVTGRTSSSGPNFQNLNKFSKAIFIARKGYKFVQMDFSQLELRIMANLARDQKMIDTFLAGKDIHSETASMIYAIEPKEVTAEQRKVGKTISFGIIYGLSERSLARKLGISMEEAAAIYGMFMQRKPHIKKWIEDTKQFAIRNGMVYSPFGRIRHLPLAREGDGHALRCAVNTPIQSCGSDINMLNIYHADRMIEKNSYHATLVCTVHDSHVYEVLEEEILPFVDNLKLVCENTNKLNLFWKTDCPLKVDITIGTNLAELREEESEAEESEEE
jgi:DNA polymerase-1